MVPLISISIQPNLFFLKLKKSTKTICIIIVKHCLDSKKPKHAHRHLDVVSIPKKKTTLNTAFIKPFFYCFFN